MPVFEISVSTGENKKKKIKTLNKTSTSRSVLTLCIYGGEQTKASNLNTTLNTDHKTRSNGD